MNIESKLIEAIGACFKEVYGTTMDALKVEPTRSNFEGQYSFVVFPYLKISKKKPEETAEEIGAYLKTNVEEIYSYNVVKGFLNLSLSSSYWCSALQSVLENKEHGKGAVTGQKVMVEYSSPNTNKPLHLGHIRNNLLGFSVSKVLEYAGNEVVKVNLINDRGIHICKSMLAWQLVGNGETPESSGMKGDHFVGKYYVQFDKLYKSEIQELMNNGLSEDEAKKQAPVLLQAQDMLRKWEDGDEEIVSLWKKMNQWVYDGFEVSYNRLGVSFEKFYYESDTYLLGKEFVEEGVGSGVFFRKEDGSIWVNLENDGLDEKLLLRADGTSVYMTQDMGTADLKYQDYACDKSIYVVGNEQEYHFKVLKLVLQKLGKPYADGIYHLSYGMVELPDGKMKSREGTVVDADDLMDEMYQTAKAKTEELGKTEGMDTESLENLYEQIGQAAMKYYLLKVDPKKKMLFNPEESIDFQGDTGPFIQYTHARINSLLAGINAFPSHESVDLCETEIALVQHLNHFPNKVQDAASQYSPAVIAGYVFDLAKRYNKFYNECSILGETNSDLKQFRLNVSKVTKRTIAKALELLGMAAPERM